MPAPTFVKHDNGKNRLDLIDPEFEWELGQVLTHGAAKYADDNWTRAEPAEAESRYTAAFKRHFNRWQAGEELDPDSGLPHLAHVAACLMFLRWFERRSEALDPEYAGGGPDCQACVEQLVDFSRRP